MNTSYAMDTYRAHDLNIAMRTSSGDKIELDFSNSQSASMRYQENENGSKASMSFSSMQSFEFHIETNGIDAQDQKEIDEFMKIAQPFIDDFLKELAEDAPKSPVTQVAHDIAAIFNPDKDRDENQTNHVKTNIVEMFDQSMNKLELPKQDNTQELIDKIFKEAQNLLEKTLEEFDNFNKNLYA
jgi:23S rRNA U2552 (ribose-2'-O)-methylase RlmE/FtsJ